MTTALRRRFLRMFLLFSAFAWGISLLGVVLPWPFAVAALQGLGAGSIPSDPMLDYWLRMASGAFALVGCLFFLFALQPERYADASACLFAGGGILVCSRPCPKVSSREAKVGPAQACAPDTRS